jgi:hypothetical protein
MVSIGRWCGEQVPPCLSTSGHHLWMFQVWGAVSLACWRRQGDGAITEQGKHIMTMHLALVYTCTFDEAWLRARFVTRSRVECWTLRCRERRNMATPSAIDLLIRSSRTRRLRSGADVHMHCSINTYWGLAGQTGSPSFCLRGQARQSVTKIRCML